MHASEFKFEHFMRESIGDPTWGAIFPVFNLDHFIRLSTSPMFCHSVGQMIRLPIIGPDLVQEFLSDLDLSLPTFEYLEYRMREAMSHNLLKAIGQ